MNIYEMILLWFFNCIFVGGFLTPVVELSQGKVRGLRLSGQDRFLSIPYASSKRFERPKQPPKWKGVYYALSPLVTCPQSPFVIVIGSEDCLYLDVHAPEWAKPVDNLPVMVYIHGGAYYHGRKGLYDPQFLVTRGAVVVTINYRLGVLGFLCLNGIANLGLRDQVAAMKWVKRNINAFGGDPDNVTLCGQSAGGSSVSMHLLSNLSKGLFHKAIIMSGTALSPWAFNVEPFKPALEDARKIHPAETESEVFNTFAHAPLRTLMYATSDVSTDPRYFKYSPCIDNNSSEPFFSDTPYELLKSGQFNKVPVMIGHTDNEGALFYRLLNNRTSKDLNDNFSKRLPSVFSRCSENDNDNLGRMFRLHYFGNKTIDTTRVKELMKYYSDWVVYSTTNAFSKLLTKVSEYPVYNYLFSYEGRRNFAKLVTRLDFPGTTHGDELFYIFKPEGLSLPITDMDRRFVDRLITMISNFMKYSNPTPKKTKHVPIIWPAAEANASNVMVLDEPLRVRKNPKKEHLGEFFLQMLCTYGLPGYVPCDSSRLCRPK